MKTPLIPIILLLVPGTLVLAAERAAKPPPAPAGVQDLVFKDRALDQLVARVPGILKSYNGATGRFGGGLFVVGDQNQLFPLAVAYATPSPRNRYHKDPQLLETIMKGGDALIEAQDPQGRFRFDKKDGSYWGQTYMPWTYSRWIRAHALIQADMPAERRARWERALAKGFAGISESGLKSIHNIPTHHAMALYIAGQALGRPEWQAQAAEFMQRVISTQKEGGYWSENSGPVVTYDYVYLDAISVYHAVSGDQRVLPAIRRSSVFHRQFTYPDGSDIETIDERNAYHPGLGAGAGNVGFTLTPEGRAYLAAQWRHNGGALAPDAAAAFVLYGREGPVAPAPTTDEFVLAEGGEPRALTLARGPWFAVLSGYTATPPKSRWVQDRQNLLSVWREGPGLIAGGGNTKLQPGWSTFTVGDIATLRHIPGDENPNFQPRGELLHTPSEATLAPGAEPVLTLRYGPATATLRLRVAGADRLEIDYAISGAGTRPAFAHLPLLPQIGAPLSTAGGHRGELGNAPLVLDAATLGGQLTFRGVTYRLPAGTTLHWPALPHNPYRKDGRAEPKEGLIELRIPLRSDGPATTVTIEAVTRGE